MITFTGDADDGNESMIVIFGPVTADGITDDTGIGVSDDTGQIVTPD